MQAQPDDGPALCVLGLIDALGAQRPGVGRRPSSHRAHAAEKRCLQRQPRPSILRHHGSLGGREGARLTATGNCTASPAASQMLSYGALKLFPSGIRSAAIRASKKSSPRSRRNRSPGCSRPARSRRCIALRHAERCGSRHFLCNGAQSFGKEWETTSQ